jgi:hypothetical protein
MLLISKNYMLGMPFAYRGDLPADTLAEPVQLKAADFRDSTGIFYAPKSHPQPKIAVLAIHPRVDFSRHYCAPHLVAAGMAYLGLNSRCLNNDATAVHEQLIFDVNAGVKFLREIKGAQTVILFGNSGGGSLSAFFQAQAQLPPGQRLETTPAGDATRLNDAELFPADALVAVSAHRGQGAVLNECIDPSVVDEADPTLFNTELDMYDQANGFMSAPEPSRYSAEFVKRYRKAQLARVQRLDDMARNFIDDARQHEKLYKSDQPGDFMSRHHLGRRGALERVMVVYRTMADLNYVDHSLDPSGRDYGSLLTERPDLMNMQYMGFARVLTPRAWLSTWSGISSNANLVENIARLHVPILVCNARQDVEIYPADCDAIWDAVTVADKTRHDFGARHYFEPAFGETVAPDVTRLMETIIDWIKERFE